VGDHPAHGMWEDLSHPEGGASGIYFYVDPLNLAFVTEVTNEIILGLDVLCTHD
jgi:hypothetical protein